MSVDPEHALLTEHEFDRLVEIIPTLTATQLWNVADTFGRRIVTIPKAGGVNGAEATTERSYQDEPHELNIGFRA